LVSLILGMLFAVLYTGFLAKLEQLNALPHSHI
jgi:hypothetical protein